MQKTTKSLVTGVFFGAVAGAIAGILFAPKSGKETRAEIAKFSGEIKDKIAGELSKMSSFTRDNYNAVVDKVVGVYEAAKKISKEDAAEMRSKLDENFEKVEEVAKKTRRNKDEE